MLLVLILLWNNQDSVYNANTTNKMVISSPLEPLEFADCLLDSPEFRENVNRHEKELDKTSHQIKRIIKEVKELLGAAASKRIIS